MFIKLQKYIDLIIKKKKLEYTRRESHFFLKEFHLFCRIWPERLILQKMKNCDSKLTLLKFNSMIIKIIKDHE
jgi:hypothetical protein